MIHGLQLDVRPSLNVIPSHLSEETTMTKKGGGSLVRVEVSK